MDFKKYQKETKKTAIYPPDEKFAYLPLGLAGEAGEVAEKFKKIIRDKRGEINEKDKEEIKKELGDVLWYLSQISGELGIELEDVAKNNLSKLSSRKKRDKLKGNGDNR
jgi:NTP pyrophosphatase (non-canonical NTP hydrolase)